MLAAVWRRLARSSSMSWSSSRISDSGLVLLIRRCLPSLAEVTPGAGQIQWHRTLAGKTAKGAMAMDQKELAPSVAVRTRLSREETADNTRAVLEGLVAELCEGVAKRLSADNPP